MTPERHDASSAGLFGSVVQPRTLNMVALGASVLWLLGIVAEISAVADRPGADVWDYVAAVNASAGFLIVTVIAWVGAAICDRLGRP